MARKPMSKVQRDAFRDRMAAARNRKDAPVMARRGRKSKNQIMTPQGAAQFARALASAAAGKPYRAKRGPRTARVSSMSDQEMALRQAEAAALLGASKRGFLGRTYDSARGAFSTQSKRGRRKNMARGKKGVAGQQSYSQLTGQLPIQVSIELAEGLFSLASVGVDIYTASTKSAADDVTFPIVQRVLSSAGRWGAQRYLSRKHAGLAATIAHGFSAMNGDRNGNFIRNNLKRFLQPAGQSGPPTP